MRAVQTSVRYTTIYAPFDGTIGISQVKMGSPVTAGQTVLNTLSSDNPVTVDFAVDQREIYRFSQLQQKNMRRILFSPWHSDRTFIPIREKFTCSTGQ